MITALAIAALLLGLFFLGVAALGAVRLPDFYARAHATGVTETLGALLFVLGLAIYHGLSAVTVKLVFLLLFLYLGNPTVTHVLTRAALRCGLAPRIEAHAEVESMDD